ncbi:MAG: ECF transporter S component [Clostridia bacterium]|nr:ECF transporter S component [Clostridia bacterium]
MQRSVTQKIVGIALFSALSFVVSLLEFPIFPAASFLKLDFSAVFTLLGGFMYGPIAGIIICAVKELIRFIFGSSTGGVGEIANFLVITSLVIIPTVAYRFKKGLPVVIITLVLGVLTMTAVALMSNRFIMFPLYMGEGAAAAFNGLWYYVLFFNLIKGFAVSLIVFLLYKRVSWIFKKINLQSSPENDTIDK